MEYKDLIIPTINVNDTKVIISGIKKENLDFIKEDEMLYCVETSKATEDYYPHYEGYVVLFVEDMDEVEVGKSAGMIFKNLDDAKACLEDFKAKKTKKMAYENINASKKAIAYAEKIGFDLSLIKKDGIIKTEDIDNYLNAAKEPKRDVEIEKVDYTYNNSIQRVVVLGAGRGSMQVLDLINHIPEYKAVGIYDDTPELQNTSVDSVPVIGKIDFEKIASDYSDGRFDYIVNGIGYTCEFRKKCYDELTKRGVKYCNLIHPSVIIGGDVALGSGNIILPMCHIGPHARIGNDCFLTAQTSIEHHNIIGSHCMFGPGVKFSGSVTVGECTRFGAGIYAEPWLTIGSYCKIASGVILIKNIPDKVVVRNKSSIDIVENR